MDEQAGIPPPVGVRGDRTSVRVGQLVKSIRGRDAGQPYVVVKQDTDRYAWVADGKRRTLAAPKRKNVKHLWVCDEALEVVSQKLEGKGRLSDKELRENLLRYAGPGGVHGEEVDDSWQKKT